MIRKYRKKPIVIESVQFIGDNESEIITFTKSIALTHPECLKSIKSMRISTLEGDMIANVGDWIIKGVNGEFYPCKPDIFEKTYEIIEQTDSEYYTEKEVSGEN